MSPNTKTIYIASPYRQGHIGDNLRKSFEAAEALVKKGWCPYLPLLNHYWGQQFFHEQVFWLDYDIIWLDRCDALVRLPGKSDGADEEVRWAKDHGIPIYKGVKHVPRA